MDFNPDDAVQRGGFELLPQGDYEVEVIEAEERTSQKGNAMIALTLQARHPDGYDARVWDYLVSVPAAVFKIKMFCEAAGLTQAFESGRLTADQCTGSRLQARISIDEGRDGFGDRNSVESYASLTDRPQGIATMPDQVQTAGTVNAPTPMSEDQIPF